MLDWPILSALIWLPIIGGVLGALVARHSAVVEETHAPNPDREVQLSYG